jgi:1-acyl-sn-glycerol-3-phosphate acyltransferase
MNRMFYTAFVCLGRFVFGITMRLHLIRPDVPEQQEGGYVLALTHLGNIDPFCSSVLVRRPIRWMARREFFRFRPLAWLLHRCGAFSVNRHGVPVSSIRRAIDIARQGQVVGICPEGGRRLGPESAVRGGVIKKGVCSVAIRSGVPVVPCVMLGTPQLNQIGPWIPAKRATLWVAYGEPVIPPAGKSTRATREALRAQLSNAYVRLYEELRSHFSLDDPALP